ncbi:hypothetical protein GGI19_000870 [Coemansia pectinata]|uniref:Auxin efflux carrier n=1 Tax=Coemansia pectinata TaxID=1052879 RepID=A0A9W8GZ83_9FUNG|nr:hypothetical protein GGI19_000870 [Coemansia pectinata]
MTETLDPALLKELWNEPVFYFIYGGFSLLWSRMGSRVLKISGDYARLCDVATFFSNTNTLPVSLIKSIALSSGSQFLLKDANDTPLKVAARGVSYAMIFATLNNILRWSFGVALMGGMEPPSRSAFNSVNATPRIPMPGTNPNDIAGAMHINIAEDAEDSDDDDANSSNSELVPLFLGSPAQRLQSERSQLARLGDRIVLTSQTVWESMQRCITPPVYAIVAAFTVIMIEPLHESFMDPNTVLYTLWSAIDMCGDACVPLILISLGGQLGMMAREATLSGTKSSDLERQCDFLRSDSQSLAGLDTPGATRTPSTTLLATTAMRPSTPGNASGPSIPSIVLRSATETNSPSHLRLPIGSFDNGGDQTISQEEQRRGIILVLVGRFVFVPTLAIILISTLRIFFPYLLPIMADDPVYILTLLILSSTPPAINLITVSQATGKFETEAAQILFYGYVLGIFVMAVEVSGFLWLTNIFANI